MKYNPEYHDDWAWSLTVKGATVEEIAEAFGITERTVYRWVKKYDSFRSAVESGRDAADAKVIKSLYQRAIGYEYTEEHQIVEIDPKTQMPKPLKVEKYKRRVPPDVGAQCFWLKNRLPDKWRDRHELTSTVIDDDTRAQVEEFMKYELTSSETTGAESG